MLPLSVRTRFIYAELVGGLGNQIFVFEMARYLSSLNNGKVLLNDYNIDRNHSKGKSTIKDFQLPKNVRFTNYGFLLNKYFISLKQYLKYVNKIAQKWILVLDDSDPSLDQNTMIELINKRNPKLILVFGFWQNFSYWINSYAYSLCKESKNFQLLSMDLVEQNPVIFHYRLSTENEDWEKAVGILNPNFLDNAISALNISTLKKIVNIWVFSNNIDMARDLLKNYKGKENYSLRFIDDSGLSPAEIIMLFSKSQFLICSNSTFSFVSAKIGNVPNVVVPSNLSKNSGGNISTPNKWIKVHSSWLH
jgi:hypothetical protein